MADSAPSTTIVPFTNTQILPSCAVSCGALYDANGGCVPPAVASTLSASDFTSCFCLNTAVVAFSSQETGVCTDCDAAGQTSIASWFRSICSVDDTNNNNNEDSNNESSASASATATSKASTGGGGDWLSNHYQWVIMLVILVVGIAGIWIGACIWRRRYLRKRDRQNALTQKQSGSASRPSWGPGVGSGSEAPDPAPAGYDSQRNSHAILTAGTTAPVAEKAAKSKDKKRWIVKERT